MTAPEYHHVPPSCAVVVCTKDRPTELACCLRSIAMGTHQPEQLIVVDNKVEPGAAERSTERIAADFDAAYVHVAISGLSRARNAGLERAQQDIVVFIDDDACADKKWLASLLAPFADPRTTVTTGRCIPIPDVGLPAIRDAMGEWWQSALEGEVVDNETDHWQERAISGVLGTGGNMAIRRRGSEWWSGFDVRLGRGVPITGHEEHEAIFAHLRHGGRVVYTPHALVTHPVPESMEAYERMRKESQAAYVAYLLLLFTKYPDVRRVLWQMAMRRVGGGSEPAGSNSVVRPSYTELVQAVLKGSERFLLTLRRS